MENVLRCKNLEAGVHIKIPINNSYQDGLGRTTQTLDHVVVVHYEPKIMAHIVIKVKRHCNDELELILSSERHKKSGLLQLTKEGGFGLPIGSLDFMILIEC